MCSSSVSDSEWYGGSSYGDHFAEHPVFYGFTEAVFVSQFDMFSRNVHSSSLETQEPGPLNSQMGSCDSRGSLSELFAKRRAHVNRSRDHRTHVATSNAKQLPDGALSEETRRKTFPGTSVDSDGGDLVAHSAKRSEPIPIVRRKRVSSFV